MSNSTVADHRRPIESARMTTDPVTSPEAADISPDDDNFERTRMSFGDHLEELRSRLIRALVGFLIAVAICLAFGKEVVQFLIRPLQVVQHANGLQPNLQALAPTDAFTVYLKVSLLSAVIVAMPWILHQSWSFVASGLYAHERRFARSVVGSSAGLFVIGVAFLYCIVLPIALQFFITFNRAFDVAGFDPAELHPPVSASAKSASADPAQTPNPADKPSNVASPSIPIRSEPPPATKPGDVWINAVSRRLVVQTSEGVWSTPLEFGALPQAVQSQFAIDAYLTFVLTLALAFGLTFETPIVVCFLAWTGLVTTQTMRSGRRYAALAAAFLGAVLTPSADLLNQLLLAVPMYLLFELGLLVARLRENAQFSRS